MEQRLEDLEVRITYLESTVDELNQVVIKQQGHIDLLIEELKRQKQQLEQGGEWVRPLSEETPPPHY
ncbi:hypothetical protein Tel_03250 [Candidatus Tenderia electrophaga]|jgi:SlyX protein|uniref:SlyX protein n=1 Tax=Candidatus Tenderia electrophaga TaxID=1748243 RepID=A0A0S2TAV5_9GAMM|nr:hypothetical protein Tel_03250 [Candidatus Tenderia electrophaga]